MLGMILQMKDVCTLSCSVTITSASMTKLSKVKRNHRNMDCREAQRQASSIAGATFDFRVESYFLFTRLARTSSFNKPCLE